MKKRLVLFVLGCFGLMWGSAQELHQEALATGGAGMAADLLLGSTENPAGLCAQNKTFLSLGTLRPFSINALNTANISAYFHRKNKSGIGLMLASSGTNSLNRTQFQIWSGIPIQKKGWIAIQLGGIRQNWGTELPATWTWPISISTYFQIAPEWYMGHRFDPGGSTRKNTIEQGVQFSPSHAPIQLRADLRMASRMPLSLQCGIEWTVQDRIRAAFGWQSSPPKTSMGIYWDWSSWRMLMHFDWTQGLQSSQSLRAIHFMSHP